MHPAIPAHTCPACGQPCRGWQSHERTVVRNGVMFRVGWFCSRTLTKQRRPRAH